MSGHPRGQSQAAHDKDKAVLLLFEDGPASSPFGDSAASTAFTTPLLSPPPRGAIVSQHERLSEEQKFQETVSSAQRTKHLLAEQIRQSNQAIHSLGRSLRPIDLISDSHDCTRQVFICLLVLVESFSFPQIHSREHRPA